MLSAVRARAGPSLHRLASTLAQQQAAAADGKWAGTSTSGSDTKLYIDGKFVSSTTDRWINVHDPSTQTVLTKVPQSTPEEMRRIADSAHEAFLSWRESSVLTRQRVLIECVGCVLDEAEPAGSRRSFDRTWTRSRNRSCAWQRTQPS